MGSNCSFMRKAYSESLPCFICLREGQESPQEMVLGELPATVGQPEEYAMEASKSMPGPGAGTEKGSRAACIEQVGQ